MIFSLFAACNKTLQSGLENHMLFAPRSFLLWCAHDVACMALCRVIGRAGFSAVFCCWGGVSAVFAIDG